MAQINASQIDDLNASKITAGTFADARIAESNVTQHEAALSITESQISDFGSYQPLDAGLTSISGLTTAADRMIYTTGSDTYSVATLTSAARSILDDASTSAIRTTLGVGTGNSPQFTALNIGNATDTTVARVSAGQISVEGVQVATISNSVSLTNKTIDGDSNTISNLDIGNEVDWAAASDVADRTAFASGDKLLIFEDGVGLRKIDYDDLPSGGGSVSFGSDNQIPYTNSGGTDFDYSANLTFDGNDLIVNTSDLFVDGSEGRVGIGTASPERIIHVSGEQSGGIALFERTPSTATDAAYGTFNIKATHDGNMGDGFGSALQFMIEDNAAVENTIANIQALRAGADNSGTISLVSTNAGSTVVGLTVQPSGDVTLPNGGLIIEDTAGIDVNPGSDTDTDLITVGVTGSPTISWDESNNGFFMNQSLLVSDGGLFKVQGGNTEFELTESSGLAVNSTHTNSSGTEYGTRIIPTFNQSGTASYTALHIDITETATGSGTKNAIQVEVDSTEILSLDNSGNLNLVASGSVGFNGTAILSDSSGTMTLSNVDALDATTESTIEAAIDTLANLTSAAALTTVGTLTTGNADAIVSAASTTTAGKIEVATAAETTTGTAANRAVSPDGLAGSDFGIRYVQLIPVDFTADLATGDGKFYYHVPAGLDGMNLVEVHAEVITAGTTGTTDIQIHNVDNALDMLSTKLTIDSGETGSDTAATAAVINASNDHVNENDVVRLDIDAVSTTAPKGLIVTMGFQLP